MKQFFIFLVFMPFVVSAQVVDGFDDGNFTSNPTWSGDTLSFRVNSDSRLQLYTNGSDTALLSTPTTCFTDTEWQFWVRLGFNTSSNNYVRVYLMAEGGALGNSSNGYYIQIGGGADSIDLMKRDGPQLDHLYRYQSYGTSHSSSTMRFKITRSSLGLWEAYIDTTGGTNFTLDGAFYNDGVIDNGNFGLWCKFTSSNATKVTLDDVYAGPLIIDNQPPLVGALELEGKNLIAVTFSEAVEKNSAQESGHYRILGMNLAPDSVVMEESVPNVVRLFFGSVQNTGMFDSLYISGVKDLAGNVLRDTTLRICFYTVKQYDVVIHEILADPEPAEGLPVAEFIELYNRTQYPITLYNWVLAFGTARKIFPRITMPPNAFLIISKDSSYKEFGSWVDLFSSSASLSNEGTTVTLMDNEQHVIHSISYSPDWMRNTFKEEGGWSLEMIDFGNPCGCAENWIGSSDPSGGTPGRINSNAKNNPDETGPFLIRAAIVDSAEVKVWFSEPMDSLSILEPGHWSFDSVVNEVIPLGPAYNTAKLMLEGRLIRGEIYSIGLGVGAKDCAGNALDSMRRIRVAIPDSVTKYDLIINEFLSNPASGGSRFLEIYNRSERVLDLNDLLVSAEDTIIGLLPEGKALTNETFLIFPGDYQVFTDDPYDIEHRFYVPWPERVEKMAGFPVLEEEEGVIILARRDNFDVIDKVVYREEMHHSFLSSREGISLERVNTDALSSDLSNWHSAASTVGFATPGYLNSQNFSGVEPVNGCEVTPRVISPDNDGLDDYLVIDLHAYRPDYVVKIDIYNAQGRKVYQLTDNSLLSAESRFIWNGTTDEHTTAKMGIYILYIEMVHPDGGSERFKKAVAVAGKF